MSSKVLSSSGTPSIEGEKEGYVEPLTPEPPRLRILRQSKSMSSEKGALSQLSQEVYIKMANMAMKQQEGTNYVTSNRKRGKYGESSTSFCNDERCLHLLEL